MDDAPVFFGPNPSMDQPFLEPGGLERVVGDFRDDGEDVARAETHKRGLRAIPLVRIAFVHRRGAEAEESEGGRQERLVREVAMHVLTEISAVANVSRLAIEHA